MLACSVLRHKAGKSVRGASKTRLPGDDVAFCFVHRVDPCTSVAGVLRAFGWTGAQAGSSNGLLGLLACERQGEVSRGFEALGRTAVLPQI